MLYFVLYFVKHTNYLEFCFVGFLDYRRVTSVLHKSMILRRNNFFASSLSKNIMLSATTFLYYAQQEQKAAERENSSNVSTMRVSGPRPLDPDRYERFACAVCMKIAAPVLLGPAGAAGAAAATGATAAAADGSAEASGAGGKEAVGKEAGGGEAAAVVVDATIAECAKCGVRVHRECYGVPQGLGAPGAGETITFFSTPQLFTLFALSVRELGKNCAGPGAGWGCCLSVVASSIYALHETYAYESGASVRLSPSLLASGGTMGGGGREKKKKLPYMGWLKLNPALFLCGRHTCFSYHSSTRHPAFSYRHPTQPSMGHSPPTSPPPPPPPPHRPRPVPPFCTHNTQSYLVGTYKYDTPPYNRSRHQTDRNLCITYHHTAPLAKGEQWHCVPCAARVNQPSCTLCPRKGGAFLRIKASQYCHAYCAERTPGAQVVNPLPPTPPPLLEDNPPEGQAVAMKSEGAGAAGSGGEGAAAGAAGAAWAAAAGDGAGIVSRMSTGGKGKGWKGKGKGKAAKKPFAGKELAAMAAAAAVVAASASSADAEGVEAENVDEEDSEGSRARRGRSGSASSRKSPTGSTKALAGKLPRGKVGSAAAAAAAAGGRGADPSCCVKTADTKAVPKEIKKIKCHICKRRSGASVACAHTRSPCEHWMHPMCAAHSGRHSRTLSPEEAKKTPHNSKYAITCEDHTARCLRQLSRYDNCVVVVSGMRRSIRTWG